MYGLDCGIDAPYASLGKLLLLLQIVIVAVEYDPPVIVERLLGDVDGILPGVHPIRELAELLGDDGVEDHVDHGHVLRRSNGAELEP